MSSSNADNSSSSSKKQKTTTAEEELDTVQQYLLSCPLVPKNSIAIQAALKGIDQERKRIERDAKLMKKFSSVSAETEKHSNVTSTTANQNANVEPTMGTKNKDTVDLDDDDDDALMEWQDVAPKNGEAEAAADLDDDASLGRRVSQAAINNMAHAGTTVKTPLAAMALALHAALLDLGFVCTGVPPTESNKGGFAPSIRPLPKSQFVPPDWDKHCEDEDPKVMLRYRKNDVGAVNLDVSQKHTTDNNDEVEVQLRVANSKEPHPTSLKFALEDHCNLDSFHAALAGSSPTKGVLPALHYKALPVLMANFCNTFDLGPIAEQDSGVMDAVPAVAMAPPTSETRFRPATTPIEPRQQRDPLRVYNPHENPNIGQFQQPRHPRGDFAGDLLPGGLVDPTGVGVPPPGNLMGPNHPMFQGGGGGPALPGQGLGMKPRFDPYGPPGGPTDPNFIPDPNNPQQQQRRPRPPPGGTGDPNPDHQRPPSDLSNNMFS